MTDAIATRYQTARAICHDAGAEALRYFRAFDTLSIDRKGHQDLVSEADRNVEVFIREALARSFPEDGIVGEEHAPVEGTSGFTWVIDPIDGTANFVRGIPAWTVVLACVHEGRTALGVVHDPVHDEMHHAQRGGGAFTNDRPIRVAETEGLHDGSVGIGFSNRSKAGAIERLVTGIVAEGGVFYRNASGALSLAYVAGGKLIGYAEDHMNAWDYLAGHLIVAEAGGTVEEPDADAAIREGGEVVVAAPGAWEAVRRISDAAFRD